MRQKKDWRDSLLTLAVLFSLFRGDIDEYMRGSFASLPEVHEIFLGQSVALTETQFHNLFNSIEGHRISDVHPKNLDIDWHQRSVFTDLHTLYRENDQTSRDVTAFLLDRLESNAARPFPFVNLVQNPSNANNNANGNSDGENNNDNNNNVDSTSSAGSNLNSDENIIGAVAAPQVEELSPEDMDLIESLWRQDIDMGLSREDAYGYKSELLDKPDHPEKLKQPEAWQRFEYNIDGETGEFVPIPVQNQDNLVNSQQQQQQQQPPQGLTVQTQQNPPQHPAPQQTENNNLSLEECLQLIDEEYSPSATSPTESSSTFQSQLSPQQAEQRWQDLASIPELSHQLNTARTEALAAATQFQANQESAPNPILMNMTQPAVENPFMMNATTNGNVNLQNATNIGAQTLQQVDNVQVLQPPSVPPHEIPPQQPEIFSPLSNFANLSLNASSPLAAGDQGMNFSHFLLPADRSQIEGSFQSNFTSESGSLLLELLNEGVDEVNMDYDEQIQNLAEALDVDVDSIADSDSGRGSRSPFEDLSDAASPFSDNGSLEGATGYNSSLDSDQLKGASGGYGYSRGGERQYTRDNSGEDSFGNNYSGQPPKMENIKHNHTYAGSSGTHNDKRGSGSNNRTFNETEQQRLSRDQRRAKSLKIPIAIEKVINLPVDAFNELMKKFDMNDAQTALIRDIRRRGKNKVAAQNCRKRKIDAIVGIEYTIESMRAEKDRLVRERDMIDKETTEMRDRYAQLYSDIFQNLRDDSGDPVDPNEFTLQQMPDGTMFLVPRNGTSTHKDDDRSSSD